MTKVMKENNDGKGFFVGNKVRGNILRLNSKIKMILEA